MPGDASEVWAPGGLVDPSGAPVSSGGLTDEAVARAASVVRIPYRPRNWARPFHGSYARWLCLVLHRRAGKTTAVLNHHQRAAMNDKWETRRLKLLEPKFTDRDIKELLRGRKYGHVLPTLKQAKLTAWDILKYISSVVQGAVPNEAELSITYYPSGNKVYLFGADNVDRLRGMALSGVSFDEYADHPPNIFSEVISKALADHLGYAIFAGTIKGKNQLWQTYQAAKAAPGAWFSLWQDVDASLRTESGATITALRRAMADDLALVQQGLMSQEEYDQEWFLSVEAAIKGAYYAQQLARTRKEGRIGRVPHDPELPVDTDWDLGLNDKMAIWFSQTLSSREVRFVDYYENTDLGLDHYAAMLQERALSRGYVYGKHHAPHDIKVRELSTGKTRLQAAQKLNLPFEVTPKIGLMDGVNAARALFPRCWFDEERCRVGLECLTHYRKAWDDKHRVFLDHPVHDWASNGADAFRGGAVRRKIPTGSRGSGGSRPQRPAPSSQSGLAWMR